jgi:hypothetical protein
LCCANPRPIRLRIFRPPRRPIRPQQEATYLEAGIPWLVWQKDDS